MLVSLSFFYETYFTLDKYDQSEFLDKIKTDLAVHTNPPVLSNNLAIVTIL